MRFQYEYLEPSAGNPYGQWFSTVWVNGHPVAGLPSPRPSEAEAFAYCAEYVLAQGYFHITGRMPLFYEFP